MGGLDGNARSEVACKEGGVQIDASDDAGGSQLDDAPVVAGATSSARLPTVHPFPVVGVDVGLEDRVVVREKIFGFGKPVVCGKDYFAATLKKCKAKLVPLQVWQFKNCAIDSIDRLFSLKKQLFIYHFTCNDKQRYYSSLI